MAVDTRKCLRERRPARPQSITRLRRSVLGFADSCGASERQQEAIGLAVSEALSNAVMRAYVSDEGIGLSLIARVADQFALESPDAAPGVRIHMTFVSG